MIKFLAVYQCYGNLPENVPVQSPVFQSQHMLRTQLMNFLLPSATTTRPDMAATDFLLRVFDEKTRYCGDDFLCS